MIAVVIVIVVAVIIMIVVFFGARWIVMKTAIPETVNNIEMRPNDAYSAQTDQNVVVHAVETTDESGYEVVDEVDSTRNHNEEHEAAEGVYEEIIMPTH